MATFFPGNSPSSKPGLFEGVKLFPVVPFAPLVGQNAIQWNSPLVGTPGYWSGANPTRLTIPALPGPNPIGFLTGNIAFLGGASTDVSIVLRLDGEIFMEGASANTPSPGRLSFATGVMEVGAGDYFELLYEFADVTDKAVQIVGTSLSFQYVGKIP